MKKTNGIYYIINKVQNIHLWVKSSKSLQEAVEPHAQEHVALEREAVMCEWT